MGRNYLFEFKTPEGDMGIVAIDEPTAANAINYALTMAPDDVIDIEKVFEQTASFNWTPDEDLLYYTREMLKREKERKQ